MAVSSLKNDSLLDYSKIDIGFEAETAVKQAVQKKAEDKDILEFRLDYHKWLMSYDYSLQAARQNCSSVHIVKEGTWHSWIREL